ncbi:hypothetical protein NQ317_016979 [Molorchus minor]|uniref:Uncharacterized protein n=1 Tax=Molorchus minor TaxID=1323400 RepID=A0ABQ9IVE1_9CUCU|nr:hypothetical protein NQ317_016979 [Molorchus minor]
MLCGRGTRRGRTVSPTPIAGCADTKHTNLMYSAISPSAVARALGAKVGATAKVQLKHLATDGLINLRFHDYSRSSPCSMIEAQSFLAPWAGNSPAVFEAKFWGDGELETLITLYLPLKIMVRYRSCSVMRCEDKFSSRHRFSDAANN